MSERTAGDGAPIDQFKAFHAWLDRYARALALPPAEGASTPDPEAVRTELCTTIGSLTRGAGGRGGDENLLATRYLMAAYADELLIATTWEHQARWIDFLVEEKLFGTRHAGDKVLDRIDELLRNADPERREMALPYMFALALGFRGRAQDDTHGVQLLAGLRSDLFQLARARDPDPAFGEKADPLDGNQARRVLYRAYQYVATTRPVLLPNPRLWVAWFAGTAGLLLLASYLVWTIRTQDLREHFEGRTPLASTVQAGNAKPGSAK
ncbi:MAG: DotU family type IV/VI secretion system protein [Massilia sp.]